MEESSCFSRLGGWLLDDVVSFQIGVVASHQTELEKRSMTRIRVIIGVKGRSVMSRGSILAGLCKSPAHIMQCELSESAEGHRLTWYIT